MKNYTKFVSAIVLIVFVSCFLVSCGLGTPTTKLNSVIINKDSANLGIGDKLQLNATVMTQTGTNVPTQSTSVTVTWLSTNAEIATVDENGLVTAIADGTTTVIASATIDTVEKTANCEVTVSTVGVQSMTLSASELEVAKGYSITLTPTISPENATNKSIVWTSSNSAVASVENGVVSGISVGNATITATTVDGQHTATCLVSVKTVQLLSIGMLESQITVHKGESKAVTATFYPTTATNKTLSWSSQNSYVASIDAATGVARALNVGTTIITAVSQEGNFVASCTLTVIEPTVTNMVVSPSASDVVIGKTLTLNAITYPTDSKDSYTWYSNNEAIATVTPNANTKTAVVKGISVGTATITCVSGANSIVATSIITVKDVIPTSIELSTYNLDIIIPAQYNSLKAPIYSTVFGTLNEEATNAQITWSSSNEGVFLVIPSSDNHSIVIKAVNAGTAYLRATTSSNSVKAECVVSIGPLMTDPSGIAAYLNTSFNGTTIFLDAIEYTLSTTFTTNKDFRFVGKTTVDGHTVINGNISTTGAITLENLELKGTNPLTISGSDDSYIQNCIISSSSSDTTNAAISISENAKLFVTKSKLVAANTGSGAAYIHKSASSSIIVLNECNYSTLTSSFVSSGGEIIVKKTTSSVVGITYAAGAGNLTIEQGSSGYADVIATKIYESVLKATGRTEFKDANISYSIVVQEGLSVSNSGTTKGKIIVGASVPTGNYNLSITYDQGTTTDTDDWTTVITLTVVSPS